MKIIVVKFDWKHGIISDQHGDCGNNTIVEDKIKYSYNHKFQFKTVKTLL